MEFMFVNCCHFASGDCYWSYDSCDDSHIEDLPTMVSLLNVRNMMVYFLNCSKKKLAFSSDSDNTSDDQEEYST